MSELKHSFSTMLAAKSFAAHCAKVQCEERGGSVESHWATIIVNELDAITNQRDELQKYLRHIHDYMLVKNKSYREGDLSAEVGMLLSTIKEQKDAE